MNKNQTIIVGVFLLILHILVAAYLFGRDKKEQTETPPGTQPSITEGTNPDISASLPEIELPEIEGFKPPNTSESTPTTPSTKPKPLSSHIAKPGSRPGYLRNDLPNRRTSKVFSSLVKEPYLGAIVVDARTGKILFEDNGFSYAYPASITKLMTMLLVLEDVQNHRLRLSDMIQIPKAAYKVGGSQAYLDPRESFSIDDLMNAMVIHSANDAATALAIAASGSQDAFVKRMNDRAKALGMNATVYHTPHGLPQRDGQQSDISTAHDIALLCLELLRHPDTLRYTGTELAFLPLTKIRKEEFMLATRNTLIKKSGGYEGCDGLKTGYHSDGGFSIAATAKKGDRRMIAIVLGCKTKDTRSDKIRELLDKGFATY